MTMTMLAGPVSRDEAAAKAQAFINGRSKQPAASGKRRVKLAHRQATPAPVAQEDALYYVFDIGPEDGFVIISGDDRTPAVLGYTDKGSFSDDMPDNMRAWLQGYADQLAWLQAHPDVQNTIQKAPTKNPVGPLMTSEWNQDAPYNNNCPMFITGQRCVTGCVATAMAQVMYYHNWPVQTTQVIPSYNCSRNWSGYGKIAVSEIPITAFKWEKMLPVYGNGATDEQNAAVATLMHCCGASVKMDYADADNRGSSANQGAVAGAMKEYFDYSTSTRYVNRGDYSLNDWINLIYSELEDDRPVIYGGRASGGGHTFVVDGYDGDELFHVNWGWGGFRDGYFLLSLLNPGSSAGIGAASSSDGYSYGQEAIIGIQPPYEGEPTEPESENLGLTFFLPSIDGSTISFEEIQNNHNQTLRFYFGIGTVDENGNIEEIESYIGIAAPSAYFANNSYTVSGLADGTHKVIPISRVTTATKWVPGMDPEKEYFQVVVSGGNVSITWVGGPSLSMTSINCPGNKKAGTKQPVDVEIRNDGAEYYGIISLFASLTGEKGEENESLSGVTILRGKSLSTQLSFTPQSAGTYNLWICSGQKGNNVIGQTTVTIEAVSPGAYELEPQGLTIENGNPSDYLGGDIYGTRIKGTLSLKNTGTSSFDGSVDIVLFKDKGDGSGNYSSLMEQSVNTSIAAGETKALEFDFSNLEKTKYLISCFEGDNRIKQYPTFNSYTLKDGIEIFLADGTSSAMAAQSNVVLSENTVAVNLTGISGVESVTGGNANTLFVFGTADAVPGSLSGRNVVRGGSAGNITLTDGLDFYSPVTFTAQDITYTRTFTTGLTRDYKNWSTLVLPFEVNKVTVLSDGTDYEIDWFHSAEESKKNFWVMNFGREDDGKVYFSHAEEIFANRPYIIAVPGAEWGSGNDLTGLPITFRGENATVLKDFRAATSGENYKMKGVVTQKTLPNIYVLNETGDNFDLKNVASIDAFRAYFEATSTAAMAPRLTMVIDGSGNEATGLRGIVGEEAASPEGWYSLDGRKLSARPAQKGIYIVNGKKIVIK